ncbi:MAG TPA: sigma-70 family RNA polymerase sigma factor [Solirubrobacteraceae bacterium]|nr:sigma-70 family RNA polymerase sigma factor [Solirubrobacteraceae bacterium]
MTAGGMYCVVPEDLAPVVHDQLCAHWEDEPGVVVVLERRRAERRTARGRGGRRLGERRGTAPSVAAPELPRDVHPYAGELDFRQRVQVQRRQEEDIDSDRLVVRFQRGDVSAFDGLYRRYFDRVYAYARVALRDEHEAEDVAQQVFGNVAQALPRYEVRADSSFRAWLFRITRNVVLRTLQRTGRMSPQEPAELDRRLESPVPDAPFSLEWLSDKDLAMLVERLPLSQRQVILLRYVFEFSTDDIACTLERTPVAIRMLEHRAMRGLEARLSALRGWTRGCERSPMIMRPRPLPVLTGRRLALAGFGGAAAYG